MGFATNFLSASERERIARELLSCVQPATPGHRFTSACPFHSEKTPGGAFWYDPESDSAHCYSCGNHGDLIDLFCAVNGCANGTVMRADLTLYRQSFPVWNEAPEMLRLSFFAEFVAFAD